MGGLLLLLLLLGTVPVVAQWSLPTPFRSIDLDESPQAVDTNGGELCGFWFTNAATSTRWIKFYNATVANTTVGTTTPVITFGLPGNSSDAVSGMVMVPNGCLRFDTAITAAVTTGRADSDTGAPSAGDVTVAIFTR